jgi:hypothetical protein
MRFKMLTAGVLVAVAATGVLAQNQHGPKQVTVFAKMVDGAGKPVMTLTPADIKITEDNAAATISNVQVVDWPLKVQLLLDNGIGFGADNLTIIRNGTRGFVEKLPDGTELTIVTTAPQPRFLVRATTDKAMLLQGVDRLTLDSGTGRFIESLAEATQRIERDKVDHFPVIVSVATTAGDNNVMERHVNATAKRMEEKPIVLHVAMLSAGTGSGGANQTEVGISFTKYTGGRYEPLSAAQRIATLLPELAEQIGQSYGGPGRGLFKITIERSKAGPLGALSIAAAGGLKPVALSLDGRMR